MWDIWKLLFSQFFCDLKFFLNIKFLNCVDMKVGIHKSAVNINLIKIEICQNRLKLFL